MLQNLLNWVWGMTVRFGVHNKTNPYTYQDVALACNPMVAKAYNVFTATAWQVSSLSTDLSTCNMT